MWGLINMPATKSLHRLKERGTVLIPVMLLVATIAILATRLNYRQLVEIKRMENEVSNDQGYLIALGAEHFVMNALRKEHDEGSVDTLDDAWAQPVFLPVDNGTLTASLVDLNRCFNINNLDGANVADYKAQFERLLALLDLPPSVVGAVIDWIDPDHVDSQPLGAEDTAYAGEAIPYRTPNTLIASVSELRLVSGIEKEAYYKLLPYVCAIPAKTSINVNTASPEVIMSLSEKITERPFRDGERKTFENVQAFYTHFGIVASDVKVPIDVQSQYFQGLLTASIGSSQVNLYSVFHRQPAGATQLLSRSRGTF